MPDVNPEVFARAHDLVNNLVTELERTATVHQELIATRSDLRQAAAVLTEAGLATTQLVNGLDAMKTEIQKLQPGVIARELSDVSGELDRLSQQVRQLTEATTIAERRVQESVVDFRTATLDTDRQLKELRDISLQALGAATDVRAQGEKLGSRLHLLSLGMVGTVVASLGGLIVLLLRPA